MKAGIDHHLTTIRKHLLSVAVEAASKVQRVKPTQLFIAHTPLLFLTGSNDVLEVAALMLVVLLTSACCKGLNLHKTRILP